LRLTAFVGELLAKALVGCGRQAEALDVLTTSVRIWERLEASSEHRRATLALAQQLMSALSSEQDLGWQGGDPLAACVLQFENYVTLSRASGDVDGMIYGGWSIARAFELRGQTRDAAQAWAGLGELAQQTGSSGVAYLRRAAQVELEQEDVDLSARVEALGRSETLYQAAQDTEGVLWCLHQQLRLLVESEDHGGAAEVLERLREVEAPEMALELLAHEAQHLAKAGRNERACEVAQRALALAEDGHPLKGPLEGLLEAFG